MYEHYTRYPQGRPPVPADPEQARALVFARQFLDATTRLDKAPPDADPEPPAALDDPDAFDFTAADLDDTDPMAAAPLSAFGLGDDPEQAPDEGPPGDPFPKCSDPQQEELTHSINESAARTGKDEKRTAPKPVSLRELRETHPQLRAPNIHGLLRSGETLNIIAPPKVGKSWLACDLAISKATGRAWLDRFDCEQGRVLILDNELHEPTIAHRLPKVGEARGVELDEYADAIEVCSLRGRLLDVLRFDLVFDQYEPGSLEGALVIVDAWYRAAPAGHNENDNASTAGLYNLIDRYALQLGCSFVLIHHSTKGSQSGKSVVDVGAGAGSQARATDSHLILRQHAEPGHYVLDAAVRSWPPVEPVVLSWNWPIWTPTDKDPALLKTDRPGPADKLAATKEAILKAFMHYPDGATTKGLQRYTGRPNCWEKAMGELLDEEEVIECEVPSKVHNRPDPGYKRVYDNDESF